MKSIICSLIFLVCTITSSNAQNYQNVVCGNCRGAGGWISAYGPVYCQVCRGYGYVTVPVQNTTSFRGHNTNSCTTIPIYSFYNGCWNVVTQYGNYPCYLPDIAEQLHKNKPGLMKNKNPLSHFCNKGLY